MYGYGGFAPYESVADKKTKAEKTLKKMQKKDANINPIIIQGNKISNTWWGIAWNKNLESYADYNNRIGRGKNYVKIGYVYDLTISENRINAIVGGSGSRPYNIEIKVDKLPDAKWYNIINACSRKIDSLSDLASGKFPKEFEEVFTKKGEGLFPSPKEIHFKCNCPDSASMCKHIGAVLYGIGNRLDKDPLLFFKLRGIKFEDLIKKSVEEKMKSMLANAQAKTKRVIDDVDLEGLFGI